MLEQLTDTQVFLLALLLQCLAYMLVTTTDRDPASVALTARNSGPQTITRRPEATGYSFQSNVHSS
jgi:hypothetical protein